MSEVSDGQATAGLLCKLPCGPATAQDTGRAIYTGLLNYWVPCKASYLGIPTSRGVKPNRIL